MSNNQNERQLRCILKISGIIRVSWHRPAGGGHQLCSPLRRVWQGTITVDQAPASFSPSWHNILSPSSSSSSSSRCSDGRLQLGQVPLVHAVVAHQLVRAGKLLLTVGPAASKGLLTWQGGDKRGRTRQIVALEWIQACVLLYTN